MTVIVLEGFTGYGPRAYGGAVEGEEFIRTRLKTKGEGITCNVRNIEISLDPSRIENRKIYRVNNFD